MRKFLDQNKRYENNFNAMQKKKTISEPNKKEIERFVTQRSSEGISIATSSKLISNFSNCIEKFMPTKLSLTKATQDEIRTLIMKIEQSNYSMKTKQAMKVAIKQYYTSIEKKHLVEFFKTSIKKKDLTLPSESDLLTVEEIERMIRVCKNNRDKAIIALLAESGARIGEVGAMQKKHVSFDSMGVIANIPSGKTGARRIRLIECERYLRQWLMEHPILDDNNAWLWVNLNSSAKSELHDRMDYDAMRMVVVKKAIDANVKTYKNNKGVIHTAVYPHLFRHTAATRLAKHLTEQQLKVYLGWSNASTMASTYVHMSGKAVDDAIFQMHGIKNVETQIESIRCQTCGKENPATTKMCQNCFRPLNVETAIKIDTAKKDASELFLAMMSGEIKIEDMQKYWQEKQEKIKQKTSAL